MKRPVSIIGVALVFIAGCFLRLQGLGNVLVFGDEIHALDVLRGHGYGWLFTHFSFADTCIPLTLYYRAVMDTVGLNELWMRMPGAIAGCATILLLAVFAWRRCGPPGSLLAAGMLAFSPYHVYLSREARPYPIVILLLLAATMAIARWEETSEPRWLQFAVAGSVLALYFHLLAMPYVGALGGFVLWRTLRRSRQERIAVWRAGALLVLLCALLFLPAAPSMLSTVTARAGHGVQTFSTFQNGMYLFLTIGRNDWIWETALAGAGFYWLGTRKSDGGLIGLLIACQVVFVLIARPTASDIAWVWARYVALVLPLWILLIAGGVAGILNRIKIPYAPEFLALALVIAYAGYDSGLYGLGRNRNYLVHPIVMARELDDPAVLSSLPIPAYYRQLARQPGPGGILEMPLNMGLPLYDLEQRIHRRPIYSAGLGAGMWQDSFNDVDGFRFRRMLSVSGLAGSDLPIEYVVVHKAIANETGRVYRRLTEMPATAGLLAGFGFAFTPETLASLFGDGAELQLWAAKEWGRPVYEDSDVVVYPFHSFL